MIDKNIVLFKWGKIPKVREAGGKKENRPDFLILL